MSTDKRPTSNAQLNLKVLTLALEIHRKNNKEELDIHDPTTGRLKIKVASSARSDLSTSILSVIAVDPVNMILHTWQKDTGIDDYLFLYVKDIATISIPDPNIGHELVAQVMADDSLLK